MKKLTTLLLTGLLAISFGAHSQYYYNAFINAGTNPGGLNTDDEQPGGGALAATYSTVIAANTTALTWSSNQTIPFSFTFDSTAYTSYKVSNSGVLTFTTSATTVPSFTNATIPNASIPDNSVMVWGLQQSVGSSNDIVVSKTFGTAPNRQHWVMFSSFSAPGATGSQWTYWGIVLEETTNKIYLVDQRTFNTPLSLTLGVQINSTTAYQVTGSPNISSNTVSSVAGNLANPSDNSYWEFVPGVRPANDAELTALGLSDVESNANPIQITATITNKGTANLTSVELHWTADGGTTVNTDTLSMNLPTLGTITLPHAINWTPTAGSFYDVDVWTSNPNGNTDGNPADDSLSQNVFVVLGNTVQKNAVFEQFTTAVCQFCPDGAWVAQQMETNYANVYTTSVHSCFGTDAMTNTEASQLCSTLGNNSAPSGMVDRTLFDGEATVAFGRGSGYPNWQASTWAQRALANSQMGSAVDLNMVGTFNPTTRAMSVTVNASLVDYIKPGVFTVGLMLIEDSVIGSGTGYNQVNAYNGSTGHPYAGRGNPILNYPHRRVMRDILPGTWGQGNVIPANYSLNTPYTTTLTTTIPTSWDENKMQLIAFAAYFGNTNRANYQIMNAVRGDFGLITSNEEMKQDLSSFTIYPNPTDLPFTNVEFRLSEQSRVEARIFDISGKEVSFQDFGVMSAGNQRIQLNTDNLENGFYFANFRVGDQQISKKISIQK